jgi:putative glutamine transport system substrate-binding protein
MDLDVKAAARRAVNVYSALALVAIGIGCSSQPSGDPAAGGAASVTEARAGAATGPATATAFGEARETGRAQLSFYYVPSSGFAYTDDDGNLTGVTAELLRDFATFVATEHGIATEISWYEEPRWADFYAHVRGSRGGVFGVGNVTITDRRRDEIAFSPPYLNNIAVLVTHENVPELQNMDRLGDAFRGLTALPYPGTLHETRLQAVGDRWLPGMPTREVASNDELVSLIASGNGYFGYMDVYNYWRARQSGQALRRHPVGDDSSETFGVIMPRGSDWAPVMGEFFRSNGGYAESDRFRELLRVHLGEELAGLLSS